MIQFFFLFFKSECFKTNTLEVFVIPVSNNHIVLQLHFTEDQFDEAKTKRRFNFAFPLAGSKATNFSQSRHSLTNLSPALVETENCWELFPLQRRSTAEIVVSTAQLQATVKDSINFVTPFPTCHDILEDILRVFLKVRVQILVRNEDAKVATMKSSKCGSTSVGMRAAVAEVR